MNTIQTARFLGVRSQSPPLITRVRFQLLGGLVFCVILPGLLRSGSGAIAATQTSANNALIGAAIAFVISYYFYRRIDNFPGVKAGTHVFLSVILPFSTMAILFLMLRLDYSRAIFLSSFAASLVWLIGLQLLTSRLIKRSVSIVPGGNAGALDKLPNIDWSVLKSPPKNLDRIQAVAVDLRSDLDPEWEGFLANCVLAGKPVYHSKQLVESITGKVDIEHLSENGFGSLLPNLAYLKLKQIVDIGAAFVLLPFFGIVCVFVAPLIYFNSGWPVFFVQERIGHRGKLFKVYKFRTMSANPVPIADEGEEKSNKGEDIAVAMTQDKDPRITAIGKFLRKYRIDEMPQILNILRGEMSWIGPRPEAVTLAKWYEEDLAFYPYRHIVRPGISGWAQVNQGHVTSQEQVLEKLHYDFFYIKYLSPWLDLIILVRTIRTMMFGVGAK